MNKKLVIITTLLLLFSLSTVNATDFTNLNNQITSTLENNTYVLNIMNDYNYSSTDTNHIIINTTNNYTINGNNHTIDAKNSNRIFEYTGTGTLTINNLNLINAQTDDFGGAILTTNGTIIINNSNFISNKVTSNGGAIYTENGNIYINNSLFDSNYAVSFAGAVNTRYGNLYISNSIFTNNYARTGGAIGTDGKYTSITNTILKNNSADLAGALCTAGDLDINNTYLINNHANQVNDLIAKNYINLNNNWYGNNTPFDTETNRITRYIITDKEQFIPYTPTNWKILTTNLNKETYNTTDTLNLTISLLNYNNKTNTTTPNTENIKNTININSTNNIINGEYELINNLQINENINTNTTGQYNITVKLDNEEITKTINILKESYLNLNNLTKKIESNENLTGKLTTIDNTPIINQTIYLKLTRIKTNQSKVYEVITDNTGKYALPINLAKGEYNVEAYYNTTEEYQSSNTKAKIIISDKIETTLTLNPYNHEESKNTYNLTGTLKYNNNPISNENIIISLQRTTNNQTKDYTIRTNTNGEYSLPINLAKGNYKVTSTFKDNDEYQSSSLETTIRIY